MSEPNSDELVQLIDRFQNGDRAAADQLLRSVHGRLEELSRRMLRGFPKVRRIADSSDVLQGASLRLLNSLRELRPLTPRDFFNLAATQIRRELLDLSRRIAVRPTTQSPDESIDPIDIAPPSDDLDLWAKFHEEVERLPVSEREAIGLVIYHGKSRSEAAEIFGVSERTVFRWWQSGCELLKTRLGGELPIS